LHPGRLPDLHQTQGNSALTAYLVLLAVVEAFGALVWLGMTHAAKVGKRWARRVATVMLVLGASIRLTGPHIRGDRFAADTGWAGMALARQVCRIAVDNPRLSVTNGGTQ
jgi:hypothetical protein